MSAPIPPSNPRKYNLPVPLILSVIVVAVGFGRIEDRAIMSLPKLSASAMAAVNIEPEIDANNNGDNTDAEFVPVSNATAVPRSRTRRLLREQAIASRGALTPVPNSAVSAVEEVIGGGNPLDAEAIQNAFAPSDVAAATPLGSPGLAPISNRLFAANVPGNGGGGTTGGGGSTGGGGTDGGVPGGSSGGTGGAVVTPVPEPASWIMLLTGFALIGWAMRRRQRHPIFGRSDDDFSRKKLRA